MDEIKSIYVVTTADRRDRNIFKIGRFSGSNDELIKQCKIPLKNPICVHFAPTPDYIAVESKVLQKLGEYRLPDRNADDSSWVNHPAKNIIKIINKTIKEYKEINNKIDRNDDLDEEIVILFDYVKSKKT
jgi:Meiotically up-regulated gene 113